MKKFNQFAGKVVSSIVQNDDGKNSYFIIKFDDGSKLNIVGYLSDEDENRVNLVGKPYESATAKVFIEESLDDYVNKAVKLDEGFININITVNTDDNTHSSIITGSPSQVAPVLNDPIETEEPKDEVDYDEEDEYDPDTDYDDDEEELDYEEGEVPDEDEEDISVEEIEGEESEEEEEEEYDPNTDYDEDEDISEEDEQTYLQSMTSIRDPRQREREDYLDDEDEDYDTDEDEDYDTDEDDDFEEDVEIEDAEIEDAEIDDEEEIREESMENVLNNQLASPEFNRSAFSFHDTKSNKDFEGVVLAKLSNGNYLFKTDEGVKKIHVDNVHEEIE